MLPSMTQKFPFLTGLALIGLIIMFGLGGGELFVVIVLAFLIIGPKDLPRVAHQIGRLVRQFRNAATEVKTSVEREVNLHDD